MDFLDFSTQYAAAGFVLVLAVAFLLFQPTGLVKWLQKKNYQYEVTFSLYMLTPTEKFIFNSVLFLTISMFSTACILYLPNHIVTMSRRAYYYFAGDAQLMDVSRAYQAAVNTAAAAQEGVNQAAENLGWN